ncbi:MAG: hypothetical protein OEN50_17790 [Deltaproteobacteria bacterium]|nr:hypothetical protein [Deltaproteobacteria bacterium]
MKILNAVTLQQRISFVALVIVLIVLVFPPSRSGSDGMQGAAGGKVGAGNTVSSEEIKGEAENLATREAEPKKRDRWDYYLALTIAGLTSLGVVILIYLAFSKSHGSGPEEQRSALYLIVVALIIEGVLIGGILHIDVKQYEAIYAAIAGYVLGTMGKQGISPGGGEK